MAEATGAAPEEPQETPEEQAPEVKPPLIPAAVVRFSVLGAVLAVVAVGAIFLVTDVIAPRLRSMGDPEAVTAAEEKPQAQPEEPGEIVKIEDLIVNPAGTGGRRFLKVAAAIEVHDPKTAREAELRSAQLRDLLLRDLAARTLDELTDPVAKEEMRVTIIDELNEILGQGKVTNLYFTEYVVQ